jgi:hypothetical protein
MTRLLGSRTLCGARLRRRLSFCAWRVDFFGSRADAQFPTCYRERGCCGMHDDGIAGQQGHLWRGECQNNRDPSSSARTCFRTPSTPIPIRAPISRSDSPSPTSRVASSRRGDGCGCRASVGGWGDTSTLPGCLWGGAMQACRPRRTPDLPIDFEPAGLERGRPSMRSGLVAVAPSL